MALTKILPLLPAFSSNAGQIDRGASLKWVSQFAAENEHTLLPLSNFEVIGLRRDQNCNVLEVDLNVNVHSSTLEDLRGSRQQICLDFGLKLVEEARLLLSGTMLKNKIDAEADKLLAKILYPEEAQLVDLEPVDFFNNLDHFRQSLNVLFDGWRRMLSQAGCILVAHAEALLADFHDCLEPQQQSEWFAGEQAKEMEGMLLQSLRIFNRIKGGVSQSETHAPFQHDNGSREEEETALMRIYDLLGWLIPRKPGDHNNLHHDFAMMLVDRGTAMATGGAINFDQALNALQEALGFPTENYWEKARNWRELARLLERRGASATACDDDYQRALEAYENSVLAIKDGFEAEGAPHDERYLLFVADVDERVGMLLMMHMGLCRKGWDKLEGALAKKIGLKGVNDQGVSDTLARIRVLYRNRKAATEAAEDEGSIDEGERVCRIFNILAKRDPNIVVCLDDVHGCMREMLDSANVLQWGCCALQHLLKSPEPDVIKHFEDMIRTIAKGMTLHQLHVPLAKEGCIALEGILRLVCDDSPAGDSVRLRLLHVSDAPLPVVLTALDLHITDAELKEVGLPVVRHLICGSKLQEPVPEIVRRALLNGTPRIIAGSVATATTQLTVLCGFCILSSLLLDPELGGAAAKSVAFADGARDIRHAMCSLPEASEVQSSGLQLLEQLEDWERKAESQRQEMRKQFEDQTKLDLFPHLKHEAAAVAAEKRALEDLKSAEAYLAVGDVEAAKAARSRAADEMAEIVRLKNSFAEVKKAVEAIDCKIRLAEDHLSDLAEKARERQQHLDDGDASARQALALLEKGSIKDAREQVKLAAQHYGCVLPEDDDRFLQLRDMVKNAEDAAEMRAEEAMTQARLRLAEEDITQAQHYQSIAVREIAGIGRDARDLTAQAQTLAALDREISAALERKKHVDAGDAALASARETLEHSIFHQLSISEKAERIALAKGSQSEAVRAYEQGAVKESKDSDLLDLSNLLQKRIAEMEALVLSHISDGDRAIVEIEKQLLRNPDLEVAFFMPPRSLASWHSD